MANDDCPVIVVLYKKFNSTPTRTLHQSMESAFPNSISVQRVSTTALERTMVYTLLQHNSKRISPEYKPAKNPGMGSFGVSFLLPLAPLSLRDIGKLSSHDGCLVCGETKKALRKCSGCMSVTYCSAGESRTFTTPMNVRPTVKLIQNAKDLTGKRIKRLVDHLKEEAGVPCH